MAIKRTKAEKKVAYDKKLCQLLDEYTKVLIAVADNVGSNQLQEIRKGLRGDSIVLMGKNTLIRRCIKVHADNTGNKDFLELMPLLVVSSPSSSMFIPNLESTVFPDLFFLLFVG
jgi:large subunit ribosomal protein LP0